MFRCVGVLCLLLMCAGERQFREYNLTISHLHIATTRYSHVQVIVEHLHHEPWDIYINQKAWSTLAKISRTDPEENELSSARIGRQTPHSTKGYEFLPGLGYYKLYENSTRLTWRDAVEICKKDGSHLLILNSEFEAMAIASMIVKTSEVSRGHWVGLHDEYKEGNYITIFNKTLQSTGYSEWYKGYPSLQKRSCLWFYYSISSKNYGHVDGDCSDKQPFFCEFEVL